MSYRAISVTSKEHAELIEIEPPDSLGATEVRGRTLCSLISPGTELSYFYTGDSFPNFPGYAAVFEVEDVGSEVESLETGDICFCMGGHRSIQQFDVSNVRRVPAGLSAEKAVLARLMGVSMTTLMTTVARPGDRVMVTGAGPVGYLAAQMFAFSGYEVIAVEPDEGRRAQMAASGISHTFAKAPYEDEELAGTVALAVECSGHEQAVLDACRMVRKGGEVVLVGVPWRRLTDLYAHDLLTLVFHNYIHLRSGWEWELPHQSSDFNSHSIFSGFDNALRWLADGRINVLDLVNTVKPENAQGVYQDLLNRRADGLFMVFDWSKK